MKFVKQKRKQRTEPIDVILMLGDGALSKGVESLLFKQKNLRTRSIATGREVVPADELGRNKRKVVIVDSTICCHRSPTCLLGLLSNPEVEEILVIDPDDNRVQVLEKRQVLITDREDFANLF